MHLTAQYSYLSGANKHCTNFCMLRSTLPIPHPACCCTVCFLQVLQVPDIHRDALPHQQ